MCGFNYAWISWGVHKPVLHVNQRRAAFWIRSDLQHSVHLLTRHHSLVWCWGCAFVLLRRSSAPDSCRISWGGQFGSSQGDLACERGFLVYLLLSWAPVLGFLRIKQSLFKNIGESIPPDYFTFPLFLSSSHFHITLQIKEGQQVEYTCVLGYRISPAPQTASSELFVHRRSSCWSCVGCFVCFMAKGDSLHGCVTCLFSRRLKLAAVFLPFQ